MSESDHLDPDAALMLRVKAGDLDAFEAIVERHAPALVRFAYRFVGSVADAEDLAQESFLRAFRAAATYAPGARFSTWLLTIATNVGLNRKRWEARHPHGSLDAPVEPGSPRTLAGEVMTASTESPESDLERRELAREVQAAICSLPRNQRVALILARYEELSHAEIAAVLDLSVMAVKSLLSRARDGLRARLDRVLAGDPSTVDRR